MKHFLTLMLVLVLGQTTARAQNALPDTTLAGVHPRGLVGDWKTEITPPGFSPFVFEFGITMPSDSLVISSFADGGAMTMEKVLLQDNRLQFVMPMHGGVSCRLAGQTADLFAGVCVGQMGESVTTMTRVLEKK